MTGLFLLLIIIAVIVLSFLITAGFMFIICWAFSITFSWKIVIGVWAILTLVSSFFPRNNNIKK